MDNYLHSVGKYVSGLKNAFANDSSDSECFKPETLKPFLHIYSSEDKLNKLLHVLNFLSVFK